jgi:hypothetical protein
MFDLQPNFTPEITDCCPAAARDCVWRTAEYYNLLELVAIAIKLTRHCISNPLSSP